MLLPIAIILFLTCWISGVINRIISYNTKKKLKYSLNAKLPEIRNNLGRNPFDFNSNTIEPDFTLFFKFIFSFGSNKYSRLLLDQIIDLKAIEDFNDKNLNRLTKKYIRLNSNFIRLLLIGKISILSVFIFK